MLEQCGGGGTFRLCRRHVTFVVSGTSDRCNQSLRIHSKLLVDVQYTTEYSVLWLMCRRFLQANEAYVRLLMSAITSMLPSIIGPTQGRNVEMPPGYTIGILCDVAIYHVADHAQVFCSKLEGRRAGTYST